MRNVVFSCAVLCGLTGSASAAEQELASYFQYSRFTGLVAAHRSLPMGSQVRVVNLDNGRSVVVTIIGRGPFIRGRVIDVSTAAAVAFRQTGVATCALIRFSVPGERPIVGHRRVSHDATKAVPRRTRSQGSRRAFAWPSDSDDGRFAVERQSHSPHCNVPP